MGDPKSNKSNMTATLEWEEAKCFGGFGGHDSN